MDKVGRRSFLQLVGGVAAAGVALEKVQPAPDAASAELYPPIETLLGVGDETPLDTVDGTIATPPRDETVAPWWEDRLELLRQRDLLDPCPGCGATAWTWQDGREGVQHVRCWRCGWLNPLRDYERPCPCDDCQPTTGLARPETVIDEMALYRDAPAGMLYVVTSHGQAIMRHTLNYYDLNTDRYLHRVDERRIARVKCGLKVYGPPRSYGGAQQDRQPGGNLVLAAWEITDCYEWQRAQAEGRSPQKWRYSIRV